MTTALPATTYRTDPALLVLGDGFLELLELLLTGHGRQEAMTRSYRNIIGLGAGLIGLDPATTPPHGYRHGTECINGLVDEVVDHVFLAMAGRLPEGRPAVTVTDRLLFCICWQVEAMRHHVVYGLPLGVAAQLGVDIAAGRRPRGGRKGHNKTPLPLDMVLREVRWTRSHVAALTRPPAAGWDDLLRLAGTTCNSTRSADVSLGWRGR